MPDSNRERAARDDLTRFADRLRELRAASGLTQEELADRAGLSARAITQWERGVREPAWSNLLALCRALGVDCTAFTTPPTATPEPPRRGRPRKAAQPAQDAAAGGEAAGGSTPPEKPAARRRKPRKSNG